MSIVSKILFVLIPAFAINAVAQGMDIESMPADSTIQSPDWVESCDSVTAKKLREENALLHEVVGAAMPYVEVGIALERSVINYDLDKADLNAIRQFSNRLKLLSPYSESIKVKADSVGKFLLVCSTYNKCKEFENAAYSDSLIESVSSQLLDVFDVGKSILTDTHINQIDSLYRKANNYRDAVLAFESIVMTVDNEIGQFRDNADSDNICSIEIDNVISNSANQTSQIKAYRYLSNLFEQYQDELKDNPRSRTDDIRQRIATMLGKVEAAEEKRSSTERQPTISNDAGYNQNR